MSVRSWTSLLLGLSALSLGVGAAAGQTSETPGSRKADSRTGGAEEATSRAVDRLVEQLRLHPPTPTSGPNRLALYMVEVESGEADLIADQPDPRLDRCGSPEWSHDGRRIVYDAMALNEVQRTRLKVIQLDGGKLQVVDLGLGNCPTFSPNDDRIAFLNNSNADGASFGVWLMKADGSGRRALGEYGRPKWSPDSRQFFIVDFAMTRSVTLMDIRPEKSGPLSLAGVNLFPEPSWAGNELIVAAVGGAEPDSIALIDVSEPGEARIKETLWKRGKGPDVAPYHPVYSSATGRCVFIGSGVKGKALYAFRRGQADPPHRVERDGFDKEMVDLATSPDGRFVVFSGDRPGRRAGQPGPARDATAPR